MPRTFSCGDPFCPRGRTTRKLPFFAAPWTPPPLSRHLLPLCNHIVQRAPISIAALSRVQCRWSMYVGTQHAANVQKQSLSLSHRHALFVVCHGVQVTLSRTWPWHRSLSGYLWPRILLNLPSPVVAAHRKIARARLHHQRKVVSCRMILERRCCSGTLALRNPSSLVCAQGWYPLRARSSSLPRGSGIVRQITDSCV